MNTVFILADQHNPSFTGCYGGITRTPNIDSLAEDGTRFEYAYTPSPLCAPARACLFSGLYVHQNKCWDNCFPYNGEQLPGWGHYFRNKNVHLATVGKLDFAANTDNGVESTFKPYDRVSFDVVSLFRNPPLLSRPKYHMVNNWDVSLRKTQEHLEQDIVDEAARWLKKDKPDNTPWILNVNFCKPHSPWHAMPEKYAWYKDKIELTGKYLQPENMLHPVDREQSRHTMGYVLDEAHVKNCHAAYHAIVEEHDENVGGVINALKDAGIYEETLIIYAADHGEMLRAHGSWEKSSLYEDSVRIPLIIKYPGSKGGQCVNTPVSLIDVFPTINEALGFTPRQHIEGESFLQMAFQGKSLPRKPVFTESHANGRITGTFAIRSKQWKLVYYEGFEPLLFNLKEDPQEMNNLTSKKENDPQIQAIISELTGVLKSILDPRKVTEAAFNSQEALKQKLLDSGKLAVELEKRGFYCDSNELFYLP